MKTRFEKYRGNHPGIVLERELKKRAIKQRPFALSLNEHPQTFNAIIKGKRGLPISLALKIEKKLGLKEGSLCILQFYYDINFERQKITAPVTNPPRLRKILFWDTDINKLDWVKQYKAVIRRVFERGNESEKKEIELFYGKEKVRSVLKSGTRPQPSRLNS